MTAALVALALAIPLTAAIWQRGRIDRRRLTMEYQREDLRSQLAAAAKRLEEYDAKLLERMTAVELTTGSAIGEFTQRLSRCESNVGIMRKAG